MAKYFAKLDNSDTTITLRDSTSTLIGKKVLNIVLGNDEDTESSVTSFHNDGHSYIEYYLDEESNPRGKAAFVDGYYIQSTNAFTNNNSFESSWKLDGTDYIFGPPQPWPMIDIALTTDTDGNEYNVEWEESPSLRLIRKKLDAEGSIITPEVVQVYNTSNSTWEDEA